MMLHNEYLDEKRRELVATARQILSGETGLIVGCRIVVGLLHELGADFPR